MDLYGRRIEARTGSVVPVVARKMHRVFWVPRTYASLIAIVLDGKPFHQRDVAARAGYFDASGVNRALKQMHRLGILVVRTTRGRNGTTRCRLSDDCVAGRNVATTGTDSNPLPSSERENQRVYGDRNIHILPLRTAADGAAAWAQLRGLFVVAS